MSATTALSVIAPQYDSISNRTEFLAMAENQTSRCWYGRNADRAVALLAAHLITLNQDLVARSNGEAGSISSKSEDKLSISFAMGKSEDGDLSQTHYGRQLLTLRKGGGAFIGVTGGYGRGC